MQFNAFVWGSVGGLLVELIDYLEKLKDGDYEDQDNAFRANHLKPCIISTFAGGIMAYAISLTPSEVWSLVIGMTASGFISRFRERKI